MFKKPFKLKSQVQLKSTEKKKFGNDLKSLFPALTDENISSIISSKDNISKMKIITWKDEEVELYCINKTPMYIDVVDSNIKLPTVFMVWKFPHILPVFTTNSSVLDKLKNGADLFYPGIYPEGLFFCEINFKQKDPVGVNLIDNKAVVATGLSVVNKDEIMDINKSKDIGKLMKIYHCVGDYLFKVQTEATLIQMGPPDWTLSQSEELTVDEDISEDETKSNIGNDNQNEVLDFKNTVSIDENDTNSSVLPKESLDDLLEYCFMKALKTIPKNSLPILPATFYANHVLASLPEGKSLNIKKTKWKKFSTFLQEKSLEGLIILQSIPKNEFTLAGVNTSNKKFKEFVDPYSNVPIVVEPKSENKTIVQQIYSVNASTLPFFSKFGLKKHDELTRNDVRNHLNDFIKSENLAHPEKPELIVLNPVLYEIFKGEEIISRANLLSGLLEKMSVQHKISKSGEEAICHKGKMPLIEFEICLRKGNKKVTLISNLESYGINVVNFSKEMQHKAAASTTIVPTVPGKKGPQLQVQGNQIAVACKILKEKHNLNEKFMKGLEKIIKSKSKQ